MQKKNKDTSTSKNGIVTQAVAQAQNDLRKLTELLGNDDDLAQFFLEWLTNGRNAKRAYLKLHPEVSPRSAEVLGSKILRKIEVGDVLAAFGLNSESYFKQLKEGMAAKTGGILRKFDKFGNVVQELDLRRPDHKVRRLYHEPLGQMLGYENKKGDFIQQLNIAVVWQGMANRAKERGFAVEEVKND